MSLGGSLMEVSRKIFRAITACLNEAAESLINFSRIIVLL